jgi:hypothetical protein
VAQFLGRHDQLPVGADASDLERNGLTEFLTAFRFAS